MIPEKMSAMLLVGHGGVEKLVYKKDLPRPIIHKNEILVKVTATAKNNTDRKAREGLYPVDDNNKDEIVSFNMSGDDTFTFPRIQGADVAGVICRSTTGTGTSARLAFLNYEGKLHVGDKLETVSLRETKFIGIFIQ